MNSIIVAFHTLGCKLNFAETSTLIRKFRELGSTSGLEIESVEPIETTPRSIQAEELLQITALEQDSESVVKGDA